MAELENMGMSRVFCVIPQTVLLTFCSFYSVVGSAAEEPPGRRPNIVFIFVDDMGYSDPSCFGNPMVKTPTMDRLAAEGIRLTNFYSNSPICSPSRVAVTTGQYPSRWKIHSYLATRKANRKRQMADFLAPTAPTVAKSLKQVGYATAHFGKWHMGGGRDVDDAPEPSAYGFDEHLVNFEGMGPRIDSQKIAKHKWTETYVDRAIDFIRRNQETPFFLRLFPNDVHDRHSPAPGAEGKWTAITADPTWRRFFAVLEEMDRQIGRLVDEIDTLGLAEHTLIVLTSDNGPTDWPSYYRDQKIVHPPGFTGSLYGRKWSLFEGGIRMPFIARWKGRIQAGTTNDQSIVAGIDLPVVFCKLAGVPVAEREKMDGVDMTDALLGQPIPRPSPVFWQYGKPFAELTPGNPRYVSPTLAVRDGRWKLLMNADGSELQLYDVVADAGEKNNLADDQPVTVHRMKHRLLAWYCEMGLVSHSDDINSLGIKMVTIGPGEFMMGSTDGGWDERPVHRITIRQSFRISATEVTNAQYEQFDPQHQQLRGKLGFSREDDEAVVFVTWHDATAFCKWLSEKEEQSYRLPTEAEWEFACRAGTATPYWTGETLPAEMAKNAGVSWFPGRQTSRDAVSLQVAQTPANPWGLFDMHGNVEEWCFDWYGPYESGDRADPVGRGRGDFRVTRGGSHSTTPEYLRSANRSGTLPEDSSWLIGFRIVQAAEPQREPLAPAIPPLNARNVRQDRPTDMAAGLDPSKPYFLGPRCYVRQPAVEDCPVFNRHNHCPALVNCPNGDLLAIWYTCRDEPGRELGIVASRLSYGEKEWQAASDFWDAPDRNDHASALWVDHEGTIYHFNGLSAAATWGSLATVLRTSRDNGASWSKARLIMPEHGLRHMPVESVIRSREGALLLPCDAVTGGQGGTAVLVSQDEGQTWTDPGEGQPTPEFTAGASGAWIAGIHAGFAQTSDGRLIAFGRGDPIEGRMPMSISGDQGRHWTYRPSPFPPIGGGQRLVILRLREGPLLFCSFGQDVSFRNAAGQQRRGSGLFAALSTDEGKTWQVKRLITDDGAPKTIDGGGNTGRFTMGVLSAEPRGYLSICQASDGAIHLISSRQHYAFNLAWLNTPVP